MKKLIILALAVVGVTSVAAQGLVGFNLGAATYTSALDGSALTTAVNAKAQLLAGPAGTGLGALQPIGTPIDPIAPGRFLGIGAAGEVAVPGIAGGATASIGVLITADNHVPLRQGGVDLQLKTPGATVPAPNLSGVAQSAALVIPEPSTIALGALGAALLFFRRRK